MKRREKTFAQEDLSGWLSPEEELLLNLFRQLDVEQGQQLLYRLTRERFLESRLEDAYDVKRDRNDPVSFEPELLEELRLLRPEPGPAPDVLWHEPEAWNMLMITAWPEGYDKVILGSPENSGANADGLLAGLHRIWDTIGHGPTVRRPFALTRRDCLEYVELWRQNVMQWVFRDRDVVARDAR